jgi:ornithine cyclodeaminase
MSSPPAAEEAFRLWGQGDVVQPIKSTVRWGPPPTENARGRIVAMAARVGGGVDMAGMKWIPSMPGNPRAHGLPRACVLIILSDPHTVWSAKPPSDISFHGHTPH